MRESIRRNGGYHRGVCGRAAKPKGDRLLHTGKPLLNLKIEVAAMPKYEYKFELNLGEHPNAKSDAVETELNALGSDGWELVAVSPTGKENSWTGYWFKRDKVSE